MHKARRSSAKRDAILNAVRSTNTHPSAEWVYAQLKPDYPDLSLGTVYRNLALFKGQGEIISIGNVNGQERFDGNVTRHSHFVCAKCGNVIDLPLPEDLGLKVEEAIVDLPLETTGYSITYFGVCCENSDAE